MKNILILLLYDFAPRPIIRQTRLKAEMLPEQKRELRAEFRNNGWLNTDEIRAAVKAYRLFKGKVNIDEVVENFNILSGGENDS